MKIDDSNDCYECGKCANNWCNFANIAIRTLLCPESFLIPFKFILTRFDFSSCDIGLLYMTRWHYWRALTEPLVEEKVRMWSPWQQPHCLGSTFKRKPRWPSTPLLCSPSKKTNCERCHNVCSFMKASDVSVFSQHAAMTNGCSSVSPYSASPCIAGSIADNMKMHGLVQS